MPGPPLLPVSALVKRVVFSSGADICPGRIGASFRIALATCASSLAPASSISLRLPVALLPAPASAPDWLASGSGNAGRECCWSIQKGIGRRPLLSQSTQITSACLTSTYGQASLAPAPGGVCPAPNAEFRYRAGTPPGVGRISFFGLRTLYPLCTLWGSGCAKSSDLTPIRAGVVGKFSGRVPVLCWVPARCRKFLKVGAVLAKERCMR